MTTHWQAVKWILSCCAMCTSVAMGQTTTKPSNQSEEAVGAIHAWQSKQPEFRKQELVDIRQQITRTEQRLQQITSNSQIKPDRKRDLQARMREKISELRARQSLLQRDPKAPAYPKVLDLTIGAIGILDRYAEARVVQVIGPSDVLVDFWSVDAVDTGLRRAGYVPTDDATPISELPAEAGFGRTLISDLAKPVWISDISTSGMVDGSWLPKIEVPLIVDGTKQYVTTNGSSRTVLHVARFVPPAAPTTAPATTHTSRAVGFGK